MITYKELMERVVSVAQRKKQARRMSKLQKSAAFQLKKKRNSLRIKDTAKLTIIAKKKITQAIRDKFYKDYENMSMVMKVQVDQKIQQKYGPGIAKKVMKAMPKLKAAEKERVKAARASYGDKDE